MVKEELAGRFSDFHALRYTFNTWLHTNGVPQRMAQELMRHSDLRLTDQVYLDSSLLPLQDCMRSIGIRTSGHKNGHRFPAKRVIWRRGLSEATKRLIPLKALYQWALGEICRKMTRRKSGGMDGTRTRNRVMLNPSRRKGFRL